MPIELDGHIYDHESLTENDVNKYRMDDLALEIYAEYLEQVLDKRVRDEQEKELELENCD